MANTFRVTILFCVFYVINCEIDEASSNNRMIGIDAIHDVKIDKDTIITRNLKPDKRGRGKSCEYTLLIIYVNDYNLRQNIVFNMQ